MHDAHSVVRIFALDGKQVGSIALPGIGSGGLPGGHREDRIAYYGFTSYTYPTTIYRYDTQTGKSTVAIRPKIAFDPAPYVTEQLFTTSKDGTRIPVFVTHRKDMPLDGTTPTILYGYGGFNISITPSFSSAVALWLQMGGAYAVATLRGGGEYGDAWHDAGRLANKQHVFDDFIAAAQMLIDKKITSTPKLAANGGSNGGLLVGAAITQRPDLFGAAIPEVGVLDMLRFQKFTVGKAWVTDYGSSEASADQFKYLYAYSPYHNVKDGTKYPPTMVMTSDHDDRVFPAHSFKFAAALQHAQSGDAPVLLRVESKAGHGAGRPTEKIIDDVADRYRVPGQEPELHADPVAARAAAVLAAAALGSNAITGKPRVDGEAMRRWVTREARQLVCGRHDLGGRHLRGRSVLARRRRARAGAPADGRPGAVVERETARHERVDLRAARACRRDLGARHGRRTVDGQRVAGRRARSERLSRARHQHVRVHARRAAERRLERRAHRSVDLARHPPREQQRSVRHREPAVRAEQDRLPRAALRRLERRRAERQRGAASGDRGVRLLAGEAQRRRRGPTRRSSRSSGPARPERSSESSRSRAARTACGPRRWGAPLRPARPRPRTR